MEKRTALVTGSARGIGHGIAQSMASAHKVIVADLAEDQAEATAEAILSAGGEAIGLAMDVTDGAAVREGVARAEAEVGPIDVAVNNAGWDELMPFLETDEEFWEKVIDINYKGVLRVSAAVLPGMVDRGWGRIVNIGSDAARVGSSLEAVYSGAKGAVISFTKTLARETARKGVTANSVCPGPTETPLLDEIVAASGDSAKVIGAMKSAVPMKRLGRPEDLAAAVLFLAGEDAGFITGQTLSVSGGLTMA